MRHMQEAMYNKRPVIVVMGWDNNCNGYFMTVEPVDQNNPDADEDTGLMYTNLDDPELKKTLGYSDGIEIYKKRLLSMQIEVPPEFFGRVLAD